MDAVKPAKLVTKPFWLHLLLQAMVKQIIQLLQF
jgi:hypothetical protein